MHSKTISLPSKATLTSSFSFIKMIAAGTGGTVTNYSKRFSLSGMTGTFPAAVTTGLLGLSGTNGPATENNYNAAGGNAAGAGGSVAAGATVPYTQQTGPIRYAPMQGKPGTKITAKSATPKYPSSSVSIAKTWLPTPEAITTQTVSATYSTSSHANTVSNYFNHGSDSCKELQLMNELGCCGTWTDERHAEIFGSLEGLKDIAVCCELFHVLRLSQRMCIIDA